MDRKEGYGIFTFANGNKFEVSVEQSVTVNEYVNLSYVTHDFMFYVASVHESEVAEIGFELSASFFTP